MSAEQLEILWKVALAIFAAGGFWNELKAIRKDIKRLEIKQDKYNTLQERMLKQEMWTSMHEKEHAQCQNSQSQVKKDYQRAIRTCKPSATN